MIQIILAATKDCEQELEGMGFHQQSVWIKHAPGDPTDEAAQKSLAEKEIFGMRHQPHQFCVTPYCGAGAD